MVVMIIKVAVNIVVFFTISSVVSLVDSPFDFGFMLNSLNILLKVSVVNIETAMMEPS